MKAPIEGIPAEAWATAPLLDPANVGRFVRCVWNSNVNYTQNAPIVKIGRTNVHVKSGRRSGKPYSMRVNADGETATGDDNGYGVSCLTLQRELDNDERMQLLDGIRRAMADQPIPVIRAVAAIVGVVV